MIAKAHNSPQNVLHGEEEAVIGNRRDVIQVFQFTIIFFTVETVEE